MRKISDIKIDIAHKAEELRLLYAELDRAMIARDREVCLRFDAGESFNAIGSALGMHHTKVKNILWRSGRTLSGRLTLKALRKAGV